MELVEFLEDDMMSQIDLAAFFNDSPDNMSLLGTDAFNTRSPGRGSLSIDDIENTLMKDGGDSVPPETAKEASDSFFVGLLIDSPSDGSGGVVHGLGDKDSDSSNSGCAGVGDKQLDAAEVVDDGKNADDPIVKKRQR